MEEGKRPGQPALFKSVVDLDNKIKEYYQSCQPQKVNPDTDEEYTTDGKHPTITGLAHYLGFESRQSFYDYEERPEFSYTIKRARLAIESNYEQALFSRNPTGPIFALKNLGWTDKQEVVSRNVNYNSELTRDEIKKISDTLDSDV
jgi:hypothetical protein